MSKNETHHIYGLQFQAGDDTIVFYVGHTNDLERRANEHQVNSANPRHAEYNTEKYQWCRSLREQGLEFELVPLQLFASTDEDSEYAWILRQARINVAAGISFYAGSPLCNMKGGDFIWEMMADRAVNTAKDIKTFRENKQKIARERSNYVRTFAPDKTHYTKVMEWLRDNSGRRQQMAAEEEKRQQKRAGKYNAMLSDPERINRIKQETERMIDGDKKENGTS
jgi:hypothetical protein